MVFIKSIIIGMFAIFPGVSGSALAITFNIYDNLFISLGNIRDNKMFLFLVITGIILGVIIGSNIIIYLSNIENILYYAFIGLIISDIPVMVKKINKKGKIKYILLIISFLFSLITFLFCKNITNNEVDLFKMFFGGVLFSFGKIFPGISSSFFLIILGIYKDILILFSNPIIILLKFLYYLPFLVGVFIGLILFIRLLNYFLINKYDSLYSSLLGFMMSSVVSIFPKFEFTFLNMIGIILMIMSFIISFKFKLKKDI